MPLGHSRFFCKRDPIGSLNDYSCSPPGVGAVSVAPSVLVFLWELFLPEGLGEDSADSSLVDFLELFLLELDGLPVVSPADSSVVPCGDSEPALWRVEVEPGVVPAFDRGALLGDALALATAEAVADALALGAALAEADSLGDALAAGDALIPTAGEA